MYSQRFKMCLERTNNTINTDKTTNTHYVKDLEIAHDSKENERNDDKY